jgi:hypothetical protein
MFRSSKDGILFQLYNATLRRKFHAGNSCFISGEEKDVSGEIRRFDIRRFENSKCDFQKKKIILF